MGLARAGGRQADNIGLTADLPRLTNLEYRTGREALLQPGLQHNLVLELLNYQINIYRSDRAS